MSIKKFTTARQWKPIAIAREGWLGVKVIIDGKPGSIGGGSEGRVGVETILDSGTIV